MILSSVRSSQAAEKGVKGNRKGNSGTAVLVSSRFTRSLLYLLKVFCRPGSVLSP